MTTPTTPVALITGASSGLGRAAAELLSANGFRVFGTSRAPRPDPTLPYTMLPLDVRSDESAAACVAEVLAQAGRIDVLINSAGHGIQGALEETPLPQAQALFETNFFGVVRMVNAVLPHMRQRRSGTIINISSAAGIGGMPFQGFYGASKHAVEGYSEALRFEVKSLGIRVALVEPGFFQSGFGQANEVVTQTIADYAGMRRRVVSVFAQALAASAGPQVIAALILRIIRSPNPRLRHPIGADARQIALSKRTMPEPLIETITRWIFQLDERPAPAFLTALLHGMFGWGRGRRARES
jgi:NAD(P)-dependent dehydrogenase (short-subunit alcohol dehydrogenase family)